MIAFATGALPFADGMLLEDYLDAISFREVGVHPVLWRDKWVDQIRVQAAYDSLEGFL